MGSIAWCFLYNYFNSFEGEFFSNNIGFSLHPIYLHVHKYFQKLTYKKTLSEIGSNESVWKNECKKYLVLGRNAIVVIFGTVLAYILHNYGHSPFALTGKCCPIKVHFIHYFILVVTRSLELISLRLQVYHQQRINWCENQQTKYKLASQQMCVFSTALLLHCMNIGIL